jgi:acyl-coenzyme A synthetase/AMP-(fatty) acid ligase
MFYSSKDITITYEDLILEINRRHECHKYYHANDYIDFIVNVIIGLINNVDICLVDFRNIEKSEEEEGLETVYHHINDKADLVKKIMKSKSSIGIYSSGTEGPPKLIYQSIKRLLKSVQIDEKYNNSIWALTYNPSHSAGIQVFLQVIANKASLCDLYKCSRSYILEQIEGKSISYISGTPTFYRMLAPYDFKFENVVSITLNGEKSTSELIEEVKKSFPSARIRNIYGSTESGPLMSSDTSSFIIPSRLIDKVKIEGEELFIHHSIMSPSINCYEWYGTGDLVEIIRYEPLTINFISRKSRIINVGGQNVNPQEVEEALLLHPDIVEAQIIPRENKFIGNVITAYIISTNPVLKEKEVIAYLREKIAKYKIPRIINFVSEISIGSTGKKQIR